MRTFVFRTPDEKADPAVWWAQPDDVFFAAGACHVLAAVFLEAHPDFRALLVRPSGDHRGGHVLVVRGHLTFDWMGYGERHHFLATYFAGLRAHWPDWDAEIEFVEDPVSHEFCQRHGYRHPTRFPHDPLARARNYLRAFPPPPPLPSHVPAHPLW